MDSEKTIKIRYKEFSKGMDIFQTVLVYLISLLVPLFLGQILNTIFGATSVVATNSQLIIGSIVNATLVMTALNLKGTAKIMGVVTMPSVATILGGYVFHTASPLMVYMIPAIWVGNYVLVYMFKKLLVVKNKNYFLTAICGIVLKVAIIFGAFSILNYIGIFPEKLVANLQKAMGMTQLVTASIGTVIAYAFYCLEKKK
jgi:hypothetical protein